MTVGRARRGALLAAILLWAWGGAVEAWAGVVQRPEDLSPFAQGYGYQPSSQSHHPWIVFADREGVPLYSDPGLSIRAGQARFMQRFFVAEVSGDRRALRLVDGGLTRDLRAFSVETDYGWATVDSLLLTQVAIQDLDTRIFQKAVVVTDYSLVSDSTDARKIRKDQAVLRAAPEARATVVRPVGLQDFGYIYKTVLVDGHEWYLVGRDDSVYGPTFSDERQRTEKLFGWLIDDRAEKWASREAFEPEPDRRAPADVFGSATDLIDGKKGRILFADTLKRDPWPPSRFRYTHDHRGFYPKGTYSGVGYDIAQIGFLSKLWYFDEKGEANALGPAQVAQLKARSEALRERLEELNVVFVIDATKSMRTHLRKAADIAVEVMKNARADGANISFGAVVYRDQLDGAGQAVEYRRLDADARPLRDWLYRVRPPQGHDDQDYEEGLFAGIDRALTRVLKGSTGMNALVVIGDAGDNGRSGLGVEDLAAKVPPGTFVHGVQVTYPPKNRDQQVANEKFALHLRQLQSALASRQVENWARVDIPEEVRKRYRDVNTLLTVPHTDDAGPTGARLMEALSASRRVLADAQRLMVRLMQGEGVGGGGEEADYRATSFLVSTLTEEMGDPKLVQAMIAAKVQMFRIGYVRLQADDGSPIMRKVLLLDRNDVNRLLEVLEVLTGSGGQTVSQIVDVWKASVASSVGEGKGSMQDLVRKRTGIVFPDRQAVLRKSPAEIRESDDAAFRRMIDDCEALKKALNGVNNSPEVWFSNFGHQFTWVDQEHLP